MDEEKAVAISTSVLKAYKVLKKSGKPWEREFTCLAAIVATSSNTQSGELFYHV